MRAGTSAAPAWTGPALLLLGAIGVAAVVLSVLATGGVAADEVRAARTSRPLLHALLNATSGVLVVTGVALVRRGFVRAHVTCIVLALLATAGFLVSYLDYHLDVGSVPFDGPAWLRPIYLVILVSHATLAAVVVPLIARTVWLAARGQRQRHRALARWTFPVWTYVSVTGVLIYWLVYVRI